MTDEELRKLAEAATPGPWSYFDNGLDGGIVSGQQTCEEAGCTRDHYRQQNHYRAWIVGGERHEGRMEGDDPDIAYIAAADPQAILSLLDRLAAAEARAEAAEIELTEVLSRTAQVIGDSKRLAQARAALDNIANQTGGGAREMRQIALAALAEGEPTLRV